jgi:hypothetical protein
MLPFLAFEGRRLFCGRLQMFVWLMLTLLAGYATFSGIQEYRGFLKEKAAFIEYEKQKSVQYANYSQYGAFGFKVLLEPAAAGVHFDSSAVLRGVQGNIDATETLRVETSYKGRQLFQQRGRGGGISGLIFFLGSLLMMIAGGGTFRDLQALRFLAQRTPASRLFFRSLAARMLWLNLVFVVIMVAVFLIGRCAGLTGAASDLFPLLLGMLFLLLVLNLFFLIGLLISIVCRLRAMALLWMALAWFLAMFVVPEFNRLSVVSRSMTLTPTEQINLQNLKTILTLERQFMQLVVKNDKMDQTEVRKLQIRFAQEFLNSGYLLNISREQGYLRDMERIVKTVERQALLFPTTYCDFLCGELSSRGYYAYLNFMNYIFDLRHRFIRWYVQKRYFSRDAGVTPFVRGHENVYGSTMKLTQTFWIGLAQVTIECLVLLLLARRKLERLLFPRP